ncbi:hypothetical protein GOV05_00725 [Candidatus Woesearchaeota archaeon]|nr:hypothetical protein [Candidatus Woesearchaeota archaeon]
MKNLVFIPTYWALDDEVEQSVFDHPTLLSKNGTLGRLLRSFQEKKLGYDVLIIPTPLHRSVNSKVKKISEKYSNLEIKVFSEDDYEKIHESLKKISASKEFIAQTNLDDYPGIRNMALHYAIINNYDNIIMIDDDEIIDDDDYFSKAIEDVGKIIRGKKLTGKTGYYLQQSGTYEMRQQSPKTRKHWLKEGYINEAIKKAIHHESRYNTTPIALGGNMVMNKELFLNVPFDPYITRGEDIDYLMNAKHFGYQFLMDNQLKITHKPPKRITPYWTKMRRDIYRFIYLREKLKFLNLDIEHTDPYPGHFLGKDLEHKIVKTNENYAEYCLSKKDVNNCEEYLKNNTEIIIKAQQDAKRNARKYFSYQKEWSKISKFMMIK